MYRPCIIHKVRAGLVELGSGKGDLPCVRLKHSCGSTAEVTNPIFYPRYLVVLASAGAY